MTQKEKKKQPVKFLHTITAMGNSALCPIDRIKCVYNTFRDNANVIVIETIDGELGFEEYFPCPEENEKFEKRRNQIFEILGAEG